MKAKIFMLICAVAGIVLLVQNHFASQSLPPAAVSIPENSAEPLGVVTQSPPPVVQPQTTTAAQETQAVAAQKNKLERVHEAPISSPILVQ